MEKENQNQNINNNRRKILSLAGAAGAGALLSPLLSKAAPTTVMEAGSGVDTASYIIFKDGSTIYAKNGTTGRIDFQGSDAATVIQSAINALKDGGKIFIKSGGYNITSALIIPSPAGSPLQYILEGESKTSTVLLDSIGNLAQLLIVGGSGSMTRGFVTKNITFRGTQDVTDLITLRNTLHTCIENCELFKHKIGILFDPYGGSKAAYYGTINQCYIYNPTTSGTGIKFTAYDYSYRSNANMIINSAIKWCDIGVHIEAGDTNSIISTDFSNNNIGLLLDENADIGNRALCCRFEKNNTWDAQINSGSKENMFIGCTFASANKVLDLGTNTRFWHSYGHKTEDNILSSTFVIDSIGLKTITIPHGLAIIPEKQDCYLTVIQNTAVTDWAYDLLMVTIIDTVNVIAKINISKASATSGATAKLGLKVGNA